MSFQASTWAVKQEVGSPAEKLLLLLLANYADANGRTFVGQKTLAEDAGMSTRTVSRHMIALEKTGLITRHKRFREDGSRTSDYTVLRDDQATNRPQDNLTTGQNVQSPTDKNDTDQPTNCRGINLSEEQSVNSQIDICPPEKPKMVRGRRISEDWVLPDDWRDWAMAQGLPMAAVMREAAQFHDHWLADSSAKGVKRDWKAAWRTWIRNHLKWTREKAHGRSGTDRPSATDNHLAGIDAAIRARGGG